MLKNSKPLKTWHLVFLGALVVLAIGYRIYNSFWRKADIKIANTELRVLVADTYGRRLQGWSNKKDMGRYDGMLFVFPAASKHAMVMRGMRFPLDIIWLNEAMAVVDIAPNLPPEAGIAEEQLTVYRPRVTSTLVLEVPAGFMQQTGLKIGDKLELLED